MPETRLASTRAPVVSETRTQTKRPTGQAVVYIPPDGDVDASSLFSVIVGTSEKRLDFPTTPVAPDADAFSVLGTVGDATAEAVSIACPEPTIIGPTGSQGAFALGRPLGFPPGVELQFYELTLGYISNTQLLGDFQSFRETPLTNVGIVILQDGGDGTNFCALVSPTAVGDVLTATDAGGGNFNVAFQPTGPATTPDGMTYLIKAADTSVIQASNTSDPELTFAVTAGHVYLVEASLAFQVNGNSEFRLAVAAGVATGRGAAIVNNNADAVALVQLVQGAAANTNAPQISSAAFYFPVTFTFVFAPGSSTAFAVQFGNNVPTPGLVTTLLKGSWMKFRDLTA